MRNRSQRVDVFSALGDANRRRILELLAAGEPTVGALAAELGITQPSVSQHLSLLREVGLVESVRVGTSSHYRLLGAPLHDLTAWVESISR